MDSNGGAVTIPIGTTLRDAEKAIIEATLRHTDGNVSRAAKILGIDRTTLYNKMLRYEIPGTGPACRMRSRETRIETD